MTSQIAPQTFLTRNSAEGLQDSVLITLEDDSDAAQVENHCSKAHAQ